MPDNNEEALKDDYESAFVELINNDRFIDWEHWIAQLPRLEVWEASLLMAGLDPLLYEDLDANPTGNDVSRAKAFAKRLRRLAERQECSSMTPADWLSWALSNRHQPSRTFTAAIRRYGASPEKKAIKEVPGRVVLGPIPLPTTTLANCFAGLGRWETPEKWRKPLGDVPKWLEECRVVRGERGKSEAMWDPVKIGAALVRRNLAKPAQVRSRFMRMDDLKPWLEKWRDFEAVYLDAA